MDARHDDRDRTGCLLRKTNQWRRWRGENDINLEPYQFGSHFGAPFVLTFCGTVLNNKVLSFNIPKFAQPLPECNAGGIGGGIVFTTNSTQGAMDVPIQRDCPELN